MSANPFMPPPRPILSGPKTPPGPGNAPPSRPRLGPPLTPPGPLNLPRGGFVDSGHGNDPLPLGRQPRFHTPPGMPPPPPGDGGRSSHGPGSGAPPSVPRMPRPITPPGPGNLPPRGATSHPRGGPLPPPIPKPINPAGFDPNAYAKTLSGSQLQDFNSLRKNLGGNFTNFGRGSSIQDALNKRYGLRMRTISDPPPDLFNLMMQRQMR